MSPAGPAAHGRCSLAQPSDIDYRAIVMAAWAEVLGNPTIEASDSFFSLGGDSLSAVDAVTRISARLDVADEHEIIAIFMGMFEHGDLNEFVAFLATDEWAGASGEDGPPGPLPTSGEAGSRDQLAEP